MDKHFNFLFANKNIDVEFDNKGVAWFQGPQIADMLGYQTYHMYRMLNIGEADIHNVDIRSENGVVQSRQVMMINEYGVYNLIMSSRRPEAEQFKNWVFYTVLPSIRRYGAYIDSTTRETLNTNPNLIQGLNEQIHSWENRCKDLSFAEQLASYRARCAYRDADANKRRQKEFIEFTNQLALSDPEITQLEILDYLDDHQKDIDPKTYKCQLYRTVKAKINNL